MNEINVLELHLVVQNDGQNKIKNKKEKRNENIKASSSLGGISIRVILVRLGAGIILNVDIF